MKADRTNLYLQLLLNGALVLGLALSALVSYSLSGYPGNSSDSATLLKISLTDSILLVIILAVANLLFSKFRNQTLSDTQHLDFLTGFLTRHAFGETFKQTLSAAKRSRKPLSVLLIDIDHFRRVNEKHGQQAGDQTLTMLSKSIQSVLQSSDVTCRWAGDQFLVVLKDCTVQDACRIAADILFSVRQQELVLGKKTIRVTISIGVAQMNKDDIAKTLIARAETGLHSAIDTGRNASAIGYDWILLEYYSKPIF